MRRPRIDRKIKEQHKRLRRFEDDTKFVTENGPKIVEFDEAVKASRSFYLKDVDGRHLDDDDLLAMKIMEAVNAAKETREYIEYANDQILKQDSKIRELNKMQKIFEEQMESLDSKE